MENTKESEMVAEPADPRFPNTPIGIVRSRDAFLTALPGLLANPQYDRWCVAYCGAERIAIAETQDEVIRECVRRGLHEDECYIGCVTPQDNEVEEVKGALSFVEYDD